MLEYRKGGHLTEEQTSYFVFPRSAVASCISEFGFAHRSARRTPHNHLSNTICPEFSLLVVSLRGGGDGYYTVHMEGSLLYLTDFNEKQTGPAEFVQGVKACSKTFLPVKCCFYQFPPTPTLLIQSSKTATYHVRYCGFIPNDPT